MRPCVTTPLVIRGAEFGGPGPLFCVPLVARDLKELIAQAHVARGVEADVVEWRADSYSDLSDESIFDAARNLRLVLDREPIVFTLRIAAEGGAKQISQDDRIQCLDVLLRSGFVDIIDVELCNGPAFLERMIARAHEYSTRVIVSFHDFQATPANEVLLGKISAMIGHGADIAKIACMPKERQDVLRLLQVTLAARQTFPAVPLCTMAMGGLGSLSRVAGFLYGSDMAFAVGQEVSAPGQIPIRDARMMTEALLRYG